MDLFWEKPEWELHDRHLTALAKMPFQRQFPKITLGNGLQSIRGPRQIGKTSWLKKLLSEQVKKGAKCFFLSCEQIRDFKELTELLKPLKQCDFIFLDEISFVSEWDRTLKHMIDTDFKGALIVTGSNSFDLRRGLDRMPGRWAHGKGEYVLMPMDVFEWSEMRAQAGWPRFATWSDTLEAYFKVGGFPTALLEAGPLNRDPVLAKQTYLRWLVGDVKRRGRQEIYLKELFGQLALTLANPISLQKLAQKTQVMSYHTAQEYISTLEDCYALRTLFCVDADTAAFRFKKEKKFYFTDPIIYWIALEYSGHRVPENSNSLLAEQVAHEYLATRTKRLGYYTSAAKGEVDFLAPKAWAIEVKWVPVPRNISKAYFDLLIPQKIIWSQETFLRELPAFMSEV